jgi:hypothetical protein
MHPFHTEADILIERSVDETFEFLCNPSLDRRELTPLEDTFTSLNQTKGVGSSRRITIEVAARKLDCVFHCVTYEPPHHLVMRLEGDLEGIQTWQLTAEGNHTRARLLFEVAAPVWTPVYLQDEIVADRWSHRLAEETLANIKTAIERSG